MAALISIVAIIVILFFLLKERRISYPQFLRKYFTPKKQDNSNLDRRLMKLLQGDKDAARRLIEQAKRKNPGRAENWYYEKVISDLECDRR